MAKRTKYRAIHSQVFNGMEGEVSAQEQAAAEYSRKELAARMLEPVGSIDRKTARMEMESPLFYGVIHPTLF